MPVERNALFVSLGQDADDQSQLDTLEMEYFIIRL